MLRARGSNSLADLTQKDTRTKRNYSSQKNQLHHQRLNLPAISHSTARLQAKINEFKSSQVAIIKTLQQSIDNNLKYRSFSALQIRKERNSKFADQKHIFKEKSLTNLKKSIQKRIQFNDEADLRLSKIQQEIKQKKQAVAKKLSLIRAQNHNKIREIQQFQKSFLLQVKDQMNKNLEKQKKLKIEYEKVSQQNNKLTKTKQYERRLDDETWKQIMNLKLNMQTLMASQQQRQHKLIIQRDLQPQKNQHKNLHRKEEDKKTQKKRLKLDPKQAGRQYLDFAKKKGTTGTKENKKLKKDYLNINLKLINYDNQVMDQIGNNNQYFVKYKPEQNRDGTTDQTLNKSIHSQRPQISPSKSHYLPSSQRIHDITPILQQSREDEQNSQISDLQNLNQPINS